MSIEAREKPPREQSCRQRLLLYIKIARFDHGIKQLFIIPGVVFAVFLTGGIGFAEYIPAFILGFVSTCLIASANYVINEYLDREFDKFHPTKKNRPVVAENIKPVFIWLEYAFFSLLGLCFAWKVNRPVLYTEAALWIMGIVYNVRPLRTKEIPFLDVLSESINNALRLLIGWFIIAPVLLPPVSIVFGYWMGGAFLMAAKRFAEYRMIGDRTQASLYRKSFKYYSEINLLISCFFYAMMSLFFCGIFMIKYRIELLIAVPFLCGLFCIYFNICYKADSPAQKPEKLFREKRLMLYVLFFIVLSSALLVIRLPFLQTLLDIRLIGGIN